jgi:hypothetical protein
MPVIAHPAPLLLAPTGHHISPVALAVLEKSHHPSTGSTRIRLDVGDDRILDILLSAQALADLTKLLSSPGTPAPKRPGRQAKRVAPKRAVSKKSRGKT